MSSNEFIEPMPGEQNLICPVCKGRLHQSVRTLSCSNNHSFDLSKEGYVNLLLEKKGVPKERGDSREMLAARREFLEVGHFDFISDALAEEIQKIQGQGTPQNQLNILEIGCGEGYHLGRLADAASREQWSTAWYGLDVSKEAVRMASRSHKSCTIILANVHHEIPIADRTVSFLYAAFSPRNFKEFHRVLEEKGVCAIIIPTPKHLGELRQFVDMLKIDKDKEVQLLEGASEFEVIESRALEKVTEISTQDVERVLLMSPNFWHQKPPIVSWEGRGTLEVTFSVKLILLRAK